MVAWPTRQLDDIAQDFKYWEDASDMYREGEGTLLPLWKFYSERAKRKHVTSLCWNPEYADLFAVGYGSFDFLRQGSGLVCCYSLKNPSHPEAVFTTESGVMCVDFHPQHCSLLAVGCYDGSVQVFDVRNKLNRPIFQSTVLSGKHTEPVWQIKWQEEDLSKELNFYSVSSDGRVTLWTMSKTELTSEDAMELKLVTPGADADAEDDATLGSLASGCAFDFNKTSDHLFVVGTEEGFIHKCSKAYNSQYMETYTGHNMGVVTVAWNNMHPRMFLSASADWTVKMWDHTIAKPVMTFDLNNAVRRCGRPTPVFCGCHQRRKGARLRPRIGTRLCASRRSCAGKAYEARLQPEEPGAHRGRRSRLRHRPQTQPQPAQDGIAQGRTELD